MKYKNYKNRVSNNLIKDKTKKVKAEMDYITHKANDDEKITQLKEEYNQTLDKADKLKDEIIEKLEEKYESSSNFRVFGIKVWKIFAYFFIYSFLGYCLESVYGILTKGVFESRQSFLYGPFCGIYGLGAVIMIGSLQYFKKNNYTLFCGGYIIGSIIEFCVSWVGEMILHVKWWDYTNEPFNLDGRICLSYSIAWGLIAIYLVGYLNPKVDKFISKVKSKLPRYILPIVFDLGAGFLIFDCIISAYALNIFYSRLVYTYGLNIPNSDYYYHEYEKILVNDKKKARVDKFFSNEKMLKTYPNLKFEDTNGDIIFVKEYLSDICPYYIKLFTPSEKHYKLTNAEEVTFTN